MTPLQKQNRELFPAHFEGEKSFWLKFKGPKNADDLGVAKAFVGPDRGSREAAAFLVLMYFVNEKIKELNRTDADLGYVHGASALMNPYKVWALFLGGTTGQDRKDLLEKTQLIELGWRKVQEALLRGDLSDDDFQGAIRSMVRKRKTLPVLPMERIGILDSLLSMKDLGFSERMLRETETLTGAEIYAVGQKYLVGQPGLKVIGSTLPPEADLCEGYFQSHNNFRRHIRKAQPPPRS